MTNATIFITLIITVFSFLLTILFMPRLITYFRRKQLGQITREEGPSWHHEKDGTPTMGGVGFLVAAVLSLVIATVAAGVFSIELFLLIFALLFFAGIGFIDDYLILILKKNEGLKSGQKFLLQILGAALFVVLYQWLGFSTELYLPFIGATDSWWIYGLFAIFWIVGFSNAVNLTDGLDGLSSSTAIIAFLGYAIISLQQGQFDLTMFCAAIIGGLVGFLIFNKKPARIFMGDVGSLALGASIATVSILTKQEWLLLLIGIIFVAETASVILQVFSFKTFGKRIFKMSPIHHHFEMSGLSEQQVVASFSFVGLIAMIITLFIF